LDGSTAARRSREKGFSMNADLLKRLSSHYIIVMMLVTRLIGSVGGTLTIYYLSITLKLPHDVAMQLYAAAGLGVVLAVISTSLLALWETRGLRSVIHDLGQGRVVELPRALAAGRDAVRFCGRHHLHEAVLVPLVTTVPVCALMAWRHEASAEVLLHISIATFLGISASLLLQFFSIERWMNPVIQYLLDEGVPIPYGQLPESRLQLRVTVCFGLIIADTAIMIGALANQRALDIVRNPAARDLAVADLRRHIIYIFVAAVLIGIGLSIVLARSVAQRVAQLVKAMKRVEQGHLSERLHPTGNDELDILARQFNIMTEQLAQNNQTIRDLNSGLERKVKLRTHQLSRSRRSLKRSLDKLVEHDKLKTEFFSNVSHELRTPLTMILAPVDRLLDKCSTDSPEVKNMLEMVRLNGYRLLDLINRLLDFSKLEAGQMKLRLAGIDLNGIVQTLAGAATPLVNQRGIRLEVDCDPTLKRFAADEEKVDTIVANLISNAIKFTPGGGTIRVETFLADDRAWVSVSDSGIGIDASQVDRIFERFVQVDGSSSREFSGTGLGLSLVKGLVELHGGGIHVKSQPGKGSRFWFDLPLREVVTEAVGDSSTTIPKLARRFADLDTYQPHSAEAPANEPAATFSSTQTILVVDDTAEMRALLGELLREDFHVLFARDGQEGLELAQREHPDLILSDVMMPRMDGQEFCRHVKQDPSTAHIPFVMLTAKAELAMKIDGLNCGADDYLSKPFNEKELKARIRSLVKLRGLHQDLDHRNRELETAYNELRTLQARLVQSEKMSSLGQLIAGLAHEINNSINAVYNGIKPLSLCTQRLERLVTEALNAPGASDHAAVLGEIQPLFQKIATLSRVIETGSTRTARIIGDLKTFSHPGNEEHRPFDLHESLDMCLNLIGNSVRDRIEVHRDYGPLGRIHGPAGQLNQVFMNILNNAQQAIVGEGELFVTTSQDGDQVRVSIRDTGCGIPDDVKSKIFDPFFTTKEPGIGTGLGLSLSYGLISKLGGTIECHSTVGEGTEFVITFPCMTEAPPGAPDDGPQLELSGHRSQ
jgi:signal transduction histidine kinase